MNFPDSKVISKWSPIVDNHLKIKNIYFKYLMCHYFEYLCDNNIELSSIFIDLKSKIEETNKFRVEIVSEHLNILTGRKEFLLIDGTFFDPDSFGRVLPFDYVIEIFGLDFLKHLDISEVRNNMIDKIIGDE